ncbi:MAG TPA: citramalate synthase [Clostridia bacterium]|nr:citramalate synthase [Clostridia bacterium]
MKKIVVLDSTLRDGAQAQGISYTVEDKLKIVKRLDSLGVDYIEAGNPGSNPKDLEFFERVRKIKLVNSKLIAFGSTRRVGLPVEDDANVKSLLAAGTDAVVIFGKSWDFQVTDILKTSLDENLKMIYDTIRFFKDNGKEVVYDAEHFFDGYGANREYAVKTLKAAAEAGADSLCLCDTKGGYLPMDIFNITAQITEQFEVPIGIHCHNDNGMAAAGTIMAVQAGATQVQGTINGFGERCGNANLCTIIPTLQLKIGYKCIPDENMAEMTPVARAVSEIANVIHDERAPYVGRAAFAHKAGMHADAVVKNTMAYEIFDPELVGNERTFLMSEVAGRSAVLSAVNKVDPTLKKDSPETIKIIEKLKEMEHNGYQYEGAESSFELIVKKVLGRYHPSFELKDFKVIVNEPAKANECNSTAMIKVKVGDQEEITAAEGDGPVNALDNAARKALSRFYPSIHEMKLTDFKVRVLDSNAATAARVRVLIESTDGNEVWTTIGVSTDIIEASWKALVDSIEYKLGS